MCDLNVVKLFVFVSVLGALGLAVGGVASALTYKQDVGVNFTFNSSLSLTLSADDLHIYNLAPGSASDSNVINVKVLTNSVGGYTLNATVGNNTTYNTRNLIHNNNNISDNFASIDYSSSPTITTNTNLDSDKWAFSFSLDNGTNWSNYNGLPLYSDTTNVATLKASTEPSTNANGDDVKFKIAAKASDNKASGDYHNVINFNVVAAPAPVTLANAFEAAGKTQLYGYYQMQDMTSAICSAVEVEDDQLQLIDNRDNKVYWVAKLADGNCWMTQNLDLDLDSTRAYTDQDTDLGYNSSTGTYSTASWTPSSSTLTSANASSWVSSTTAPYSYDPGDLYWNGVTSDYSDWSAYDDSCAYGCDESLNPTSACTSSTGVAQYHLGNYYNWTAAVAMNNSSSTEIRVAKEQSICPKGWTLPRAGDGDDSFRALWEEYGWTEDDSAFSSASNPTNSPLSFSVSGQFSGSYPKYIGYSSNFWSSVFEYNTSAWHTYFYTDTLSAAPSALNVRDYGYSVRCVARPVSTTISL